LHFCVNCIEKQSFDRPIDSYALSKLLIVSGSFFWLSYSFICVRLLESTNLSVSSERGKVALSILRHKLLLIAHLGQLLCFLLVDLFFNDFVLVGFSLFSNAFCILDKLLSLFLLDFLGGWSFWHCLCGCWWLGIIVWELLLQISLCQLSILIDILELNERLLLWLNKCVGALLDDVVVNTLHHNIKSEILITVHASGEELHVHGNLRL